MKISSSHPVKFVFLLVFIMLSGCATEHYQDGMDTQQEAYNGDLPLYRGQAPYSNSFDERKFASVLPQSIDTHEKVIMVDPKVYAWGAYDKNGNLIRAGMATSGADYCPDEGKPCRTDTGTYRIYQLGNADCISHKFPIGKGGSLMPYCMFFHDGQSLHGSPDQMMAERNISHGCVHLRIPDAQWLRENFAEVGTKVTILPYGS